MVHGAQVNLDEHAAGRTGEHGAGLAKSYGERLRGCNVRNMNPEKAEGRAGNRVPLISSFVLGFTSY